MGPTPLMTKEEYKRIDWILSKAQDALSELTEWEVGFVNDMTDQLEKYGNKMIVSVRQWDVLERIAEKAI